jgi:hypothetical protein
MLMLLDPLAAGRLDRGLPAPHLNQQHCLSDTDPVCRQYAHVASQSPLRQHWHYEKDETSTPIS